LANSNLPPTTLPAAQTPSQRFIEASRRRNDLVKIASRAQPGPATSLSIKELLDRLSDEQLTDRLGITDEREQSALRLSPEIYFQKNVAAKARIESLSREVQNGSFTPDVDDNANIFMQALTAGFGVTKAAVSPIFEAMKWYDTNVADPTAGMVSLLFSAIMPGEQEIEGRVRQKMDEGKNPWHAMGETFEEWGAPGWVKFGIQLGADPLVFAGGVNLVRRGAFSFVNAARVLDPGTEIAYKGGRGVIRKFIRPSEYKTLDKTVVRDAVTGKPQLMYHGSDKVFENFSASALKDEGQYGPAVYVSEKPELATLYSGIEHKPRTDLESFQRRFSVQAHIVGAAEKNPLNTHAPIKDASGNIIVEDGFVDVNKMSPEELNLYKNNWQQWSRNRGYTEAEIKQLEHLQDLYGEGRYIHGLDDEEMWSIGKFVRPSQLQSSDYMARKSSVDKPNVHPVYLNMRHVFNMEDKFDTGSPVFQRFAKEFRDTPEFRDIGHNTEFLEAFIDKIRMGRDEVLNHDFYKFLETNMPTKINEPHINKKRIINEIFAEMGFDGFKSKVRTKTGKIIPEHGEQWVVLAARGKKGEQAFQQKILPAFASPNTYKGGMSDPFKLHPSTVPALPRIHLLTSFMGGDIGKRVREKLDFLGIGRVMTRRVDATRTAAPDSIDAAIIGHAQLQEVGDGFASAIMAGRLVARGDIGKLFSFDKHKGYQFGDPKHPMDFKAIFKEPSAGGGPLRQRELTNLTNEQIEYVEEMQRIVRDATDYSLQEGVEILPFFRWLDKTVDIKALDGVQTKDYPLESISRYLQEVYDGVAHKQFMKHPGVIKALSDKAGQEGFVTRVLGKDIEFADEKMAIKIESALSREKIGGVLGIAGETSDALRTIKASTDVGAPLIQGLPLLFRSPALWAKATLDSLTSLATGPVKRARYIRDNIDDVLEFVENGGLIGSTEFTDSLRSGGLLAKMPTWARQGLLLNRFGNSFETFLDVSKVELYKSMKPSLNGPEELRDLASHVNKMLGTMSTQALGISRSQRNFERAFIMFSPRYTRAMTSLLLDSFKGGLKGHESRRAMVHLAAGGMMAHRGFAEILGQEPQFDPTKPHFMQVKVGGVWVGYGGKMRSIYRTLARMYSKEDTSDFNNFNIFDADDIRNNPILGFLRSNAAPATGGALNLITGQNPIGEQIPDEDASGSNEEDIRYSNRRDTVLYYQARNTHEITWSNTVNLAAHEFDSGYQGKTRGKVFRQKLKTANSNRYTSMQGVDRQYPEVSYQLTNPKDSTIETLGGCSSF
jgi:hypothetical protein